MICLRCRLLISNLDGVGAQDGDCNCDVPVWSKDGLTPSGPPTRTAAIALDLITRMDSQLVTAEDDDIMYLLSEVNRLEVRLAELVADGFRNEKD
jgi:hypothetical protein